MSNLGWYQTMTTVAKKVGGPINLGKIVLGTGIVIGGTIYYGCSKIKKKIDTTLAEKKRTELNAKIYTVNKNGQSNEGLQFLMGDQFKVLEIDGDAALIEKFKDKNNPYFVSAQFLKSISDFAII